MTIPLLRKKQNNEQSMDGMQQFANALNDSSWRGVITEVGIGLEFSSRYMRVPGASSTIQGVNCPYMDNGRPHDIRAVSLENAKRLAEKSLAQTSIGSYEDTEHLFGLAITGAHYEDRPSNVWLYLATPKWDAYMHVEVAAHPDREWVGKVVADHAVWFLRGFLLNNTSWRQHIEDIGDSLETHRVDVLYGPGVGDAERLMLLREYNPLVYFEGKFHRVTSYLRNNNIIYPGAFNPPTEQHLSVASCLFEISQNHAFKQPASIEDMLHRIRMLDAADRPILITQAPRYVDKYNVIMACQGKSFSFLLGADAWNNMIAAHQYPTHSWLGEQMPKVDFLVVPRHGEEIYNSGVSENLQWKVSTDYTSKPYSSTAVRNDDIPHEHEYLTSEVAEYIKTHELYNG